MKEVKRAPKNHQLGRHLEVFFFTFCTILFTGAGCTKVLTVALAKEDRIHRLVLGVVLSAQIKAKNSMI